LRGELDAILCHALKSQPSERYATADAFAQDIERHLKGERVLAQPESIRYRLARGLRRHRAAFAAGTAIVVAVLGAAGVSLVQAKRASDAGERARVVKEFVVDVFKVNERGSAGNKDLRQLPVELLLDRGAQLIETKFPGQPQLQAELYGVVGGIFADMGANAQAADYARRQVETLVAIDAADAEQAKATLLLAQALLARAGSPTRGSGPIAPSRCPNDSTTSGPRRWCCSPALHDFKGTYRRRGLCWTGRNAISPNRPPHQRRRARERTCEPDCCSLRIASTKPSRFTSRPSTWQFKAEGPLSLTGDQHSTGVAVEFRYQ
jgi:hypothetical protein